MGSPPVRVKPYTFYSILSSQGWKTVWDKGSWNWDLIFTRTNKKKINVIHKKPDHNWDTYTHVNAYSPTKGERNWGWGEGGKRNSTSLQRKHLIKALPLSIWFVSLNPGKKIYDLIHLVACCRVFHTKGRRCSCFITHFCLLLKTSVVDGVSQKLCFYFIFIFWPLRENMVNGISPCCRLNGILLLFISRWRYASSSLPLPASHLVIPSCVM